MSHRRASVLGIIVLFVGAAACWSCADDSGAGGASPSPRAASSPSRVARAEAARAQKVHDKDRPLPPVVEPPPAPEQPAKPPSDAVVLFDGSSLDAWQGRNGAAAPWPIEGGAMTAAGQDLVTKQSFGDCQLHVEWMAPDPDTGEGQDKGNSGVKLAMQYEVQILDSYKNVNKTYADGVAGAVYGQYPPLVNACRPPGQWQTFDIVYRAPRFKPDGAVETPGRITVLHNGVLVQNDEEILGNTSGPSRSYKPHDVKQPILLQFHGHPVKFRNIWVRELKDVE